MITQGFPLWAVDSIGAAYVVVGWDEHGYPFLVPLDGPAAGPQRNPDGAVFTYTTTDPRDRGKQDTVPDSDLRQRLTALADRLVEDDMDTLASGLIRDELAK